LQYFDDSVENLTFAEIADWLTTATASVARQLRSIPDDQASEPREPGKWSRKEILGHLIDSASNNHHRFVRAQTGSVLRFPGYAQDHWVRVQHYRDSSWSALIDLWSSYNEHLARVISQIPESLRSVSCEIEENSPIALSSLALDYVGHVEHHLAQITG
jgi:hypothetical protein